METYYVIRVEALLDGRVYRWFTATPELAATLMSQLVRTFPDITLMSPERVQRHSPAVPVGQVG